MFIVAARCYEQVYMARLRLEKWDGIERKKKQMGGNGNYEHPRVQPDQKQRG